MSYYIDYTGITYIGNIRKVNQDSIVCNNKYIIEPNDCHETSGHISNKQTSVFAVFDGMGGLSCGEIASAIAAKNIEEIEFQNHILNKLKYYCQKTNEDICNFSIQNNIGSIGTTAAILAFSKRGIFLCNIGDSKIFRIAHGIMEQISKDHVTKSLWSNQKLLTQNLGISKEEMIIAPYLAEGNYQKGDIYLICSDGLTDMTSEKKIRDIILNVPFEYACKELLNEALDLGGKDNISIILCKVEKRNIFSFGKGVN